MSERQASGYTSSALNSSNTASSGYGSSAKQSANSQNITEGDQLTIRFRYGSSMICAICGSEAKFTLQQPMFTPMYFVVYDPNSKAWSKPPGGDDSLIHSSKGHACGQHLSQMQKMQKDWASTPCVMRNDGTYLYCFADYNAHKEFALARGEQPVQG